MLLPTIIAAILAATPQEVAIAKADYAAQLAQGYDCRYLSGIADEDLPVVQFVVVLASREPLLDHTIPERLPGTSMVRIRLDALRWSVEDWCRITGLGGNPYAFYANPLICRADFLMMEILDSTRSDAYYRLRFGGKGIPKTLAQLYTAFGIDPKKQRGLALGLVEGTSGVNVAKNGSRLIRYDDGINAAAWSTFDVKKVTDDNDPLEALDNNRFKADGSEVYILDPKVMAATGMRGVVPVTALADGKGNLVSEAAGDLVSDSTQVLGHSIIVQPVSCFVCHDAGPQRTTLNALRDRLEAGLELKVYDKQRQIEIELFHLADVDGKLDEWEDGFTTALEAINGCTPKENATNLAKYVRAYNADVTPERAAHELGCEPEDLQLALGFASANAYKLSVRLAGLAHGKNSPRSAWESDYRSAVKVLETWRTAK